MKHFKVTTLIMAVFFGLNGCINPEDPSNWTAEETNKWYDKQEWRNGWSVSPDETIDKQTFAKSYFKNKARWDKAFTFLKENDLTKLELKKYELEGDSLFVIISEYNSKERADCKFEAHMKYADIQYVASGAERIGIVPLAQRDSLLQAYDETKEVEFFTVKDEVTYPASPDRFFIFFPEDAHMPGLKADSSTLVRKVVVKVKLD